MMTERKTDFYIGDLLRQAGIEFTPNGGCNVEVDTALKTASKSGTGRAGFPEFTAQVGEFVLVIEDKASLNKQAKYDNDDGATLTADIDSIKNYAENGAFHYAQKILESTHFSKVFAFGCSGDIKHNVIRPIYVDSSGYKLLPEIENFTNFTVGNIERYYHEQVLGEQPPEQIELELIVKKSAELHEYLRVYGQLGDSEKPLVVSAILLALNENLKLAETLNGDKVETDGQKIYNALSTHLNRVQVQPETKKSKILNQFTIIKDRDLLNRIDLRLGKTPLRYFTEFLSTNVFTQVKNNSPEDVLGRFYGEFIRYSGGDGQTLGVVLTPRHITELFCELVEIKSTDTLLDPCCGTGGFLIAGMNKMLEKATLGQRDKIKKNQLYGIEIREDMFAIATTNMVLRGDGKSNLINDDFLAISAKKLHEEWKCSVGFINPPYSQAKGKDTAHLSEIHFVQHLLDSLDKGGRAAVIVPQSTMVGKTSVDKIIKNEILQKHTLEGVITLNKETFYRVGTNPCIAVFTAHEPHPASKYAKFVNFEDDGYEVNKHIGLVRTERATEKMTHLIDCWRYNKDAETKFMVKTKVVASDEWLHSFYYFNDEIPNEADFERTMADYLTFEFSMIAHGRGYLFGLSEEPGNG